MKLLVGLGNPGEKFEGTRHNAGFLLVDALQKVKPPHDLIVRKSDMFMNESGIFVKKLVDRYELDLNNLYIAHDDLDIPLGAYKIQFGTGPKVHNGVNSVEKELGTKDFWRIRIGVDNRKPDDRIQGEEYVLQDFKDEERKILNSIIAEICKKLATLFKNTS
jgi:PTH1 family peptidyl-tRNA hydrolase